MVKYLKKEKIHKLAQVLGYPVPAMKYCNYRFHRGSEWFTFDSDEADEYYEFYVCSSYLSVNKILDVGLGAKLISRKLYSGKEFEEMLLKVS